MIGATAVRKVLRNPAQYIKNRNKLPTPKSIFLFLTNLCNLHCEHCFYHFELNKKDQGFTLEQLEKLARSMNDQPFVCLTGGEIFIRKDLPEIMDILHHTAGVEYTNLCTNGFYVEKLDSFINELAPKKKFRGLNFQISLDGFADMHNDIRKNKKSFDNAIESIKLLQEVGRHYPEVGVNILTVITKHNFDQAVELLHETQKLGNINHGYSIVRGKYSVYNLDPAISSDFDVKNEDTTLGVSDDEWERKIQELKDVKEKYGYASPGEMNFRKFKITMDTLRREERVIPCYAGSLDGVIYPNGDVAFCETTTPFANLNDFDFDLHALWNSEAAKERRPKIANCACIHACNIINSLLEHPEMGR